MGIRKTLPVYQISQPFPGCNLLSPNQLGTFLPHHRYQELLSCQFTMDIGLQSSHVINIFYMLFTFQDCLIQMCDTPSLRDIVMEKLRQFFRSFSCDIVSPCTERHNKISIFVKRHISMHHGTESNSSNLGKLHTIFFLHVVYQFW